MVRPEVVMILERESETPVETVPPLPPLPPTPPAPAVNELGRVLLLAVPDPETNPPAAPAFPLAPADVFPPDAAETFVAFATVAAVELLTLKLSLVDTNVRICSVV